MNRCDIGKAIVFSSVARETHAGNEFIARAQRQYPERFLGFGQIDHTNEEEAISEIQYCVRNLDLIGIHMDPIRQVFIPDDETMDGIMRELERQKLPLFIRAIDNEPVYATPNTVANVLERYDIPFVIIANCGMTYYEEAIDVAKKHDNVLLESSRIDLLSFKKVLKRAGVEKVTFGSESPYSTPDIEIKKIQLVDELGPEALSKIFYENLTEFLRV